MSVNIKTTLTAVSVATVIICAPGLAQSQYPSSSPSSTTQTSQAANEKQSKAEKLKHWTGSLVDTSCMAKEMSSINSSGGSGPSPNLSHWMQAGQQGQRPMGPGQGNPAGPVTSQNPDTNPDISQGQAAQMAKASMTDQAAKRCTPTASTQAFGLALSDGQVVNFDGEGNAKASEALKEVSVQPGKKVKAKVTGTLEGETVKVASLEIKAKRSSQQSQLGASPSSPGR